MTKRKRRVAEETGPGEGANRRRMWAGTSEEAAERALHEEASTCTRGPSMVDGTCGMAVVGYLSMFEST